MAATETALAAMPKTSKEIEDRLAMPPPPPPPPPPTKDIILEPELNALKDSLKNAVAQTGLIYKFYATTAKNGVRNIQPPQSLTAALGREIEKYDQLCDAMEAHLLRAISILQRDLLKEEKRKEDELAALAARKEAEAKTPEPMTEDDASSKTLPHTQNNSPMSSSHPGRRPSAISISSLHRPPFPHKLDLSSVSFRMPPEDNAMLQSGLASPVTLAPKSARPLGPNELPGDFMAAFGGSSSDSGGRPPDIDLTLSADVRGTSQVAVDSTTAISAGDSSDKPIELDLDVSGMSDLFGDDPDSTGTGQGNMQGSDSLFSPGLVSGDSTSDVKANEFFEQLGDHVLFSALGASGQAESSKNANISQDPLAAPSPGTLLTNFPSPANPENDSMGNAGMMSEQTFDFHTIDLTSLDTEFFNQQNQDVDFSVDFPMSEATESKDNGTAHP